MRGCVYRVISVIGVGSVCCVFTVSQAFIIPVRLFSAVFTPFMSFTIFTGSLPNHLITQSLHHVEGETPSRQYSKHHKSRDASFPIFWLAGFWGGALMLVRLTKGEHPSM
jgi:hypothetical protein